MTILVATQIAFLAVRRAITVFGKTVFVLLRVCGRGYFGSWKGLFCVVIGKVCLREQFLINLICRDSASILRVELLA